MTKTTFLKKQTAAILAVLLSISMPFRSAGATAQRFLTDTARSTAASGAAGGRAAGIPEQNSIPVFELLERQKRFDPVFYADTYSDLRAAYGRDSAALENHYRTFGIYECRMGSREDTLAWRLRVIHRILRFLEYNRDYYLGHFREPEFPWFHAETYLLRNPEVRAQIVSGYAARGITPSEEQILEGAVRHYLDRGALEGKASCSAFDPVWAIVADPEIPGAYRGNLTPQDVAEIYRQRTGKADTLDLQVETPDRILQLLENSSGQTGTAASNIGIRENSENSSGDSPEGSSEKVPEEEQKKDSDLSCSVLLYLCGSDLESGPGNATRSLVQIMYTMASLPEEQAEKMNLLVCAGGCSNWRNSYLHSYLNDQKNNTALYTLDREELRKRIENLQNGTADISLTSEKQKKLMELTTFGVQYPRPSLFSLAVAPDSGEAVSGKDYDSLMDYLINSKTLPLSSRQLSTGTESISEEPVLESFLKIAKEDQADQYTLWIWDHGGGINRGACQDEENGKTLYLEEIRQAMEKSDMKAGILAFDCCLMGSAEVAYYLNGYYDYMFASEEISGGDLPYYKILPVLGEHLEDPGIGVGEALMTGIYYKFLEDRADQELSAWTLMNGAKAEAAAAALNTLAGELYSFSRSGSGSTQENHRRIVFDAMRKARTRSVMFGIEGQGLPDFDYVDAGDFLERLREELERKKEESPDDAEAGSFLAALLASGTGAGALEKAQAALNDLVIANYAALRASYIYQKGILNNGTAVENPDTMKNLVGSSYLGASLYVPYFSSLSWNDYKNSKINPWNPELSSLFGPDSAYRKLMEEYVSFIGLGAEKLEEKENERRNWLKTELTEGRKLRLDKAGKPRMDENGDYIFENEKVIGYDDILSIQWKTAKGTKQAEDYLSIEVDPDAYSGKTASAFSSGDPFQDLADTMDAMKIYVTRCVETTRTSKNESGDSGSKETKVRLDIVVGENSVSYNKLDGVDYAIHVFGEQFATAVRTYATGMAETKDGQGNIQGRTGISTLVVPYGDVEQGADKESALNAVLGKDQNRNKDSYVIFRGSVVLADSGAKAPEDVCLVFGPDKDGSKVYLGAASRTQIKEKDEYGYEAIQGVTGFRFSCLAITKDEKTGKASIGYLGDSYDLSRISPVFAVHDDINVHLENAGAGSKNEPGNADQNRYYFATMYGTGLENTYVLKDCVQEKKGLPTELGEVTKFLDENDKKEKGTEAAKEQAGTAGEQKKAAMKSVKSGTPEEAETSVEPAVSVESEPAAESVPAGEEVLPAEGSVPAGETVLSAEEAGSDTEITAGNAGEAVTEGADTEDGADDAVTEETDTEAGADEAVTEETDAEAGADEAVTEGTDTEDGADDAVTEGTDTKGGADEAVTEGTESTNDADEAVTEGTDTTEDAGEAVTEGTESTNDADETVTEETDTTDDADEAAADGTADQDEE